MIIKECFLCSEHKDLDRMIKVLNKDYWICSPCFRTFCQPQKRENNANISV